jgi:hypothetical protein
LPIRKRRPKFGQNIPFLFFRTRLSLRTSPWQRKTLAECWPTLSWHHTPAKFWSWTSLVASKNNFLLLISGSLKIATKPDAGQHSAEVKNRPCFPTIKLFTLKKLQIIHVLINQLGGCYFLSTFLRREVYFELFIISTVQKFKKKYAVKNMFEKNTQTMCYTKQKKDRPFCGKTHVCNFFLKHTVRLRIFYFCFQTFIPYWWWMNNSKYILVLNK